MSQGTIHKGKAAAGQQAADWIEDGMLVGLGTGSTVFYFIERLIQRVREGLKIECVATSLASERQAMEGQLKVLDMNGVQELDLTVDGADEIDPMKRMIKGGGGALLREKIVASNSQEMVVIVDDSKCVGALGAFPLPVELTPFGLTATLRQIEKKGYQGQLRKDGAGKVYLSDNGNPIIDLNLGMGGWEPGQVERDLLQIPGVVETGLFLGLAGRVIVGYPDGHIEIRQ